MTLSIHAPFALFSIIVCTFTIPCLHSSSHVSVLTCSRIGWSLIRISTLDSECIRCHLFNCCALWLHDPNLHSSAHCDAWLVSQTAPTIMSLNMIMCLSRKSINWIVALFLALGAYAVHCNWSDRFISNTCSFDERMSSKLYECRIGSWSITSLSVNFELS